MHNNIFAWELLEIIINFFELPNFIIKKILDKFGSSMNTNLQNYKVGVNNDPDVMNLKFGDISRMMNIDISLKLFSYQKI